MVSTIGEPLRVDMVDPPARDGAAEERRKQPVDRLRRARRRLLVSSFGRCDLGLDRFGVGPAAAGRLVHPTVIEQLVDDESLGVEAVPVSERLQRLGDRRIPASGERGVAAKKPRPFEMMARLAYAPGNPLPRVPGSVKIFGQDSSPVLEEARRHHAVELRGAGEKHLAARGLEPRQHGLEEMHVRVLFAFAVVSGQNAVIAAGRRLRSVDRERSSVLSATDRNRGSGASL